MESERDRKKTCLIIAILVGCIIILGPRLYFYSLRSTHLSTVKNDRNEASCQCGILFEYDVFDYPNTIQLCDMLGIGDVSESHLNKKFQKNVDGPVRKIEKCKRELSKFCEQELRRVSHSGTLLGGLNEKQVNILNSCSKQIDERRKLKNRKHYSYGTRKNQFQGYKPYFRQVIDSESSSPFQVDPKKKGDMALATPVFMLSVAVFFFYVFYKYVLKDKSEAKTSTDDEEKREIEFPLQEADGNKKTLEDYGNEQVADVLRKALSELSAKLETKVEVKIAEKIPVTGNQTSERSLTSNIEHLQADQDEGSVLLEYDKINSQESEVCTTETTKDHGSMKSGLESVEVDSKDMIGSPLDPSIGKITEVPLSQGINHVHTQSCEEVTEFPVKQLYFEKIEHLADTKLKTPEASKMLVEEVKPIADLEQLIAVEGYTYFIDKLSEPNVTTPVEPSQEETSEEAKKISVVENVELVELELAQMSAAKNVIEIPEKILDTKVSTEKKIEQIETVQLPCTEDITEVPQKLDETIKVSTEEIVELIESVEMPAVEEDILETLEKTLETSQVFIEENVEQIETSQILAAEHFGEIPEKKLDETSQVSSIEMLVVKPAQIPAAEKEILEIPEKLDKPRKVSTEEIAELVEPAQIPAAEKEIMEIPEKLDKPRKVSTEEIAELVEPAQIPAAEKEILEIPEKRDKPRKVSTEEIAELVEPAAEKEIMEIPEKRDKPRKVSTEEIAELVEPAAEKEIMEIPEKTLDEISPVSTEETLIVEPAAKKEILEIPEKTFDETRKVSTEEMVELVETVQLPDVMEIPQKLLENKFTKEQVEQLETSQILVAEDIMEISENMPDTTKVSTEEMIELVESVQMPVVERSFLEIPEKTLDETSQVFIEENVEQVETAQILAAENFMEIPEKKLHDETSQVSSEETLLLEPARIPAAEDILEIPEKAPDEAGKVATEEIVELLEPAQMPDAEENILEISEKMLDESSKVSTEEMVELVEPNQMPVVKTDTLEIPEKTLDKTRKVSTEEMVELVEPIQMSIVDKDILEISEKILGKTSPVSTEETLLVEPTQIPAAEKEILEIPKKTLDEPSKVSTEEIVQLVETVQLPDVMEIPEKLLENKFIKEQVEQLETSQILVAEDIMEISENMPDTTKISTEEMIEFLEPAQMPDAEENILEIPEQILDESSEVSTEETIELVESAQVLTTKEIVDKIDEFANVSSEERSAIQELEDPEETSQSIKISKEKAESGLELYQQLSENLETTKSDKEAQHLASSRQKDVKMLYVHEEMDTTGSINFESGDTIIGSYVSGNNLLESGVTQEPEGQLFMGSIKNETSASVIDYLTTTMPDKVTTPCEEVLIDAFQKPANETERNVPSTDQDTILDSSEDEKLGKLTMGNLDHEERIMVKDMHHEQEKDLVRDVCDAESVHKELQKHESPGFVGSWDKEDILESKDVQVFLEKQPSSVEVKEKNGHGRDQLDVSEL
ncbi:uncharacterized protein LOC143248776 isoform X1 [Tachypleus tridentatus]|uniref:uncharacterized protein LOC143248776 isoform X1 n=3 Tax=Tachypleus tridentatus TaxID=6853 RepID=UPI003FD30597